MQPHPEQDDQPERASPRARRLLIGVVLAILIAMVVGHLIFAGVHGHGI